MAQKIQDMICMAWDVGEKPCHGWEGLHMCTLDKGHDGDHICGDIECTHRWSVARKMILPNDMQEDVE
jgi:hypothetical protein